MLFPLYRLADRVGRVCIKFGLKTAQALGAALQSFRPAPRASRPVSRLTPIIHVTLTRRQAVVALLVVVLMGVLVAASGLERALRPAEAANAFLVTTAFSVQGLGTEVAQQLPNVVPVVGTPAPLGPTVTAPPNPLSLGGTVFYAFRSYGRTNLWALPLGKPNPVRLTAGPWDDRDPAISPDGDKLAFASHRGGSWNLYLLDLTTGETTALTTGLDFKANPAWSPDGQYLAFEWYHDNNFDVGIVSVKGGDLIRLTSDPAPDYEPTWSPNKGREMVWVSMRSGNPDLWWLSLDNPDERAFKQLTDTPLVQETDPVYSPDGQVVVYGDAVSARGLVYAHSASQAGGIAAEVGQGRHPVWSPDGSSLLTVWPDENGQGYLLAAPFSQSALQQLAFRATNGELGTISWSAKALPAKLPAALAQIAQVADAPLWAEIITATNVISDPSYALVALPGVNAPDPRLSDRVDEAFNGLHRSVWLALGWDFLGTLSNASVSLKAPPPPSMETDTWLKTGRAFDITQSPRQAGWMEITREDIGFKTYWRVWVRTLPQDGALGEPLRRPPWNLDARYSGRPGPYDAGGEYNVQLPPGYFVDFTTLAQDYGWLRTPAQANWVSFYPGVLYWRFEHRDNLDWLTALREIYTAAQAATQTPVPSPTPTPTITPTPSETRTPTPTNTATRRPTRTPTLTPTRVPTRTPSPTPTRWPTWTLTPTNTQWPTRTFTPTRTPTRTPTPTGTWYTATPTLTPSLTPTPTPTETEQVSVP